MIWEWPLDLVGLLIDPILNALPEFNNPIDPGAVQLWGQTVGAKSAILNLLLPVRECWLILDTMLSYVIPGALALKGVLFVYRHIPQMWGFGPGSG